MRFPSQKNYGGNLYGRKNSNYRDFSNRATFNNVLVKTDEELVPVVLTKEMKETLKPLGFDSKNVETWTFPHGKKVPVVFVPNKKGFMDVYMKFFNSEVERYLKHNRNHLCIIIRNI